MDGVETVAGVVLVDKGHGKVVVVDVAETVAGVVMVDMEYGTVAVADDVLVDTGLGYLCL